jgi:hypothetical protein
MEGVDPEKDDGLPFVFVEPTSSSFEQWQSRHLDIYISVSTVFFSYTKNQSSELSSHFLSKLHQAAGKKMNFRIFINLVHENLLFIGPL